MDEEGLVWACMNCSKKSVSEISPYTTKLLNYRLLNMSGFPLTEDMLGYEEWLDLGKINIWLATRDT